MPDADQNRLTSPDLPTFRLSRQVVLSGLALIWERIFPALWPAIAVIGLFVASSLFGIWSLVPWWLHLILLVGFVVAFGWALWSARGAFRFPTREEAIRRLERGSQIAHRPLTTLLDAPSGSTSGRSRTVWQVHQRRMAGLIARLRVAWPEPGLAARDPYGLRAIIILLIVVGLAGAGDGGWSRMTKALDPDFTAIAALPPGQLTAWIDQPAYTGLPPVFLTDVSGVESSADEADPVAAGPIDVVVGSVLLARVHGGEGTPTLQGDGTEQPFDVADASNFTIEVPLAADGALTIAQDAQDLGTWDFVLTPDNAPRIELAEQPERTKNGVLHLEYEAEDDFGLDLVSARIHRDDAEDDADPIEFDLALPGLAPLQAQEASYHDLTAHPWAGMPVLLDLSALDIAGQTGTAPSFAMVLPERPFEHPVAKAIIDQRRILALDNSQSDPVRAAIAGIMDDPDAFGGDSVAYLGLRTAFARLEFSQTKDGLGSIIDLLWETALRIEDGALSIAERDLRRAQEQLQEALNNDAPPEELEELMKELQATLDKYLEQLAKNSEEQSPLDPGDQASEDDRQMQRNSNDLQEMVDQARDMAMTGDRESAKQMLQQLQEMLENLETARPNADPNSQGGDTMMEQLQEIMTEQSELLEDTFRDAQSRGENERLEPGRGETAAGEQEALRRSLGEAMRQLGEKGQEIPDALGRAERMMRDARDDLEQGRPDRAVDSQAEALQQLQKGAEAVAEEMLAQQDGERPGQSGQPRRVEDGRDPLGRLPPGNGDDPTGIVDIPKKSDVQRSREILNELYRRAGERNRSEPEREYIDRLLRWY